MEDIIGRKYQPWWIVGDKQDQEEYKRDANFYLIGGGLCESRNLAIETAHSMKEDCIMIEDDLQKIELAQTNNARYNVRIGLEDAIRIMYVAFEQTNNWAYLCGVAPTNNAFYYSPLRKYSFNNFIIGSLIIVRYDCPLRFDIRFKTKEDYDYTLQHIQRYGVVLRCNQILATFQHYGNKGGVVDIRTTEVEQESIKKLQEKWGPNIALNKRRKNEILLKVR